MYIYLPISQVMHAISNLGGHVQKVPRADLHCRGLILLAWGDSVHSSVPPAATQEPQKITMTHVLHNHEYGLCEQEEGEGGRKEGR